MTQNRKTLLKMIPAVLHCAYLLRTISASLAHTNEQHNERNLPRAKLDSEINARFLLNELHFLLHNNSVHIIHLN